ncbi:MAG: methyltransferase domain-containing protein [Aeromicrobium erythreum]
MTDDVWSDLAPTWRRWWGPLSEPVGRRLLDAAGVAAGTDLLDVGCGSGEVLALGRTRGARVSGVDPAPGMTALARAAAPGADVREASAQDLPWPDAAFDVVLAVNALHLADEPDRATAELARVLRPGGRLALAGWAEPEHQDLATIDAAIAHAEGEEPDLAPGPTFEDRLLAAGLDLADGGVEPGTWFLPDPDALVTALLLGADEATRQELRAVVVEAAEPLRLEDGGYRLRTAMRWAVAVRP